MLGIHFCRNIHTKLKFFNVAYFSTGHPLRLDMAWRKSKKLPLNPMDRGVLTDGADYIFLDGRPTPFGMKQKRKLLLQREYAKKIVELSESLDIAKERYAKKIGEKDEQVKQVLNRKLKPKGNNILKT
jgi:hypothetical protein